MLQNRRVISAIRLKTFSRGDLLFLCAARRDIMVAWGVTTPPLPPVRFLQRFAQPHHNTPHHKAPQHTTPHHNTPNHTKVSSASNHRFCHCSHLVLHVLRRIASHFAWRFSRCDPLCGPQVVQQATQPAVLNSLQISSLPSRH